MVVIRCLFLFVMLFQSLTKMVNGAEREIALIITENGYLPENLYISSGEQIKFFVINNTKTKTCIQWSNGKQLLSPTFFVNPKEVIEPIISFQEEGVINAFCPDNGKLNLKVFVRGELKKRSLAAALVNQQTDPVDTIEWLPE